MIKRQSVLLVIVYLLTFTIGVGAQEADTLAGSQWQLVAIDDATPVEGSAITLAFGDDNRMVGSGGCNSYGGSYSTEGTSLSLSALFSTRIACVEEAVMAQESAYFAALQSVTAAALDGNTLTLTGEGSTLIFTRLATLADSTWTLQTLGTDTPVLADTTITLTFGSENDIGGSGGCNTYGGSYNADGTAIAFSDVFSTLIACAEPILQQELAYLAALQAATDYALEGDSLSIQYGEGETLVFQRRVELADTRWQLQSLGDAEVVGTTALTIEFRADGGVGGNSGCNSYRGSYTLEGDSLSFTPLASTRRACLDTAQAAQESAFFAALGSVSRYSLTDDQLILTYGDGEQLVFTTAQ